MNADAASGPTSRYEIEERPVDKAIGVSHSGLLADRHEPEMESRSALVQMTVET